MTEVVSRYPPTVTGFALKCALAALQKSGVATRPLLDRTALSEFASDGSRRRIPASSQLKFLELASEAVGDTAFGLHLSQQANPREAGLLFYVVSAADTLGEGWMLLERYSRIVNESVRLKMTTQPKSVIAEFGVVGIPRHRAKQNTEFWMGMIIKASREITGRRIRPVRLTFAHVRTTDLREFERLYSCPVEFGAQSDQVEFSSETFALPLVTKDPHLLETLRPFCDEAAASRQTAVGSLRSAVENEVQRQLPHGRATAANIAKSLAISVRSLSRRLSVEGTTYPEVVDQMRHSLALQYLKEPGFTSAQIAWLLGYESSTSFNHAFRRWTGRTPSAARGRKPQA